MGAYEIAIEPLERAGLRELRKKYLANAYGKVLEIGAGSGLNVNLYNYDKIDSIIMTDLEIESDIRKKTINNDKVSLQVADATKLPFKDKEFDCVVMTLVFCTVPHVNQGLQEIKRVLKDDGILIYIEHVLPHGRTLSKPMAKTMNLINPLWKKIACGCNLNRDFESTLLNAKFNILEREEFLYSIIVSGVAKPINMR